MKASTSRDLSEIRSVLQCQSAPEIPLFLPAIYEHKGHFIRATPSAISRSADLLTRAMLAEYEAITPDALTVGVDVYNLEAEAVGCEVTFYEGDDTSIPGIKPGNHALHLEDDFSKAKIPNPLKDGRMPVNVETAKRVVQEMGKDFWVRGAVSGPFSLAISLVGAETLFLECLDNPDAVRKILDYAARIIKEFSKAYMDVGAGLVMFDSQASPDLLSPAMYEELVLPIMKDLTGYFKGQGVENVPLVIGGNTTPIIPMLVETGCNNLLSDFTSDWEEWKEVCLSSKRAVRRNISPRLIETSTPEEIYEVSAKEISRGKGIPGFIMGTAVIPYGTPKENILAIKQACLDAGKK